MGSVMDPVNIGIMSLVWDKAIDSQLIQRLKTPKTELRFIQLKPTDLHEFSPPRDLHAVILLHPFTEGRLSLTDVTDARYSTLLPTLSSRYGSDGVCVIAYLLKDFKESTEQTHLRMLSQSQPTVFQKSKCVILCGKLENMFQQNLEKIQEFIQLKWSNIRKTPWLEEWNQKPATLGDLGDRKIENADNTCSKDEVDKDFRDDISHDREDRTLTTEINSDGIDDALSANPTNDTCQLSQEISNDQTPRMNEENEPPVNELTDDICQKSEEMCDDKTAMDEETQAPVKKPTVLVTDASGFIASHIVQQLTKAGYKVRGTLSSLDSEADVGTLEKICPDIDLREADITQPVQLLDVVKGCTHVIHTSRFQDNKPANGDITKLFQICQHTGGIERVVLTGQSDLISEEPLTGREWDSINPTLKDAICKYVSEKAALNFMKCQKEKEPSFGLSIIKPPVILGPILCNPAEANVDIVRRRMVDAHSGLKDIHIPVCDVRDVAKAHVKALEQTERVVTHPGVNPHDWSLHGIENTLKLEFEKQGYKFVSWKNPCFFWDEESSCLGKLFKSERSDKHLVDEKALVQDTIPKEDSLLDMTYCCIDRGFIKKKPGYRPRNRDQQETTDATSVKHADHDSDDFDKGMGDG